MADLWRCAFFLTANEKSGLCAQIEHLISLKISRKLFTLHQCAAAVWRSSCVQRQQERSHSLVDSRCGSTTLLMLHESFTTSILHRPVSTSTSSFLPRPVSQPVLSWLLFCVVTVLEGNTANTSMWWVSDPLFYGSAEERWSLGLLSGRGCGGLVLFSSSSSSSVPLSLCLAPSRHLAQLWINTAFSCVPICSELLFVSC